MTRRTSRVTHDTQTGLPQSEKLALYELRVRCVESATRLAIAKGKPTHAVYIAADLFKFVLDGEKPVAPDRTDQPDETNISRLRWQK